MNIKTEKLSLAEVQSISKVKPIIGSKEFLEHYNTANYIKLKKFYDNDTLVGYAAFFLGYNCITSNDISIEDIVYWGDINKLFNFLNMMRHELDKSQDFPFEIGDIYYDKSNFIDELNIAFRIYGFKTKVLGRYQ